MTRPASRERVQPVPALLMRTAESFNTTNNSQDGFRAKCTDCWSLIKTPSMQQEALPKRRHLHPNGWNPGYDIYAFLTVVKRYAKRQYTFLIIPYLSHKFVLTLASEVLWQAPHRWSITLEGISLNAQVQETEVESPWVFITQLMNLRFIIT